MDYFTQQVIGMWTMGYGVREIAQDLDCSIEQVYNVTDGLNYADLASKSSMPQSLELIDDHD